MQIVLALIAGAVVVLMLHIYRRTGLVGSFWADEIGAELIYIGERLVESCKKYNEENDTVAFMEKLPNIMKQQIQLALIVDIPLFDFDSMLWHFWVPLSWYRVQWSKMLDESLDEELQGYRKEYHEGRETK